MQHSVNSSSTSEPLNSHWSDESALLHTSYAPNNVADLSLSELSLNDPPTPQPGPSNPPRPKFSLLAQPRLLILDDLEDNADGRSEPLNLNLVEEEDEEGEHEEESDEKKAEDAENRRRVAARTRQERLQHDLFVLQKLNAAFSVYNSALRDTRSATERVSDQLRQTDALLNKYIGILERSEDVARVIFDERWQGAELDEELIEREKREAEDRARREEEERVLAAKKEEERREREAREREQREERERIEAEKREKLASRAGYGAGGVRGMRGTRASMRGARGASRASPTSGIPTRGRVSTAVPTKTTSKVPRPSSSASVRSTASSVR
ncbi:hypothetical protein BD410DRAFT_838299 [Rickenella mellea]|uniref:DASH complex subunit DUO1 n=1 Tax=Rickenella mellea TaxID=50990 RepID=A0A4Y7QBQ8_9AGAM|nr:hypothetical protein BD410DRAFT_838299 [Rickenella mellea]